MTISDQVWDALAQMSRAPEPAVVLAALGTRRWRCGRCGLLESEAADSSAVLVLHHGITDRPTSGQWVGATIDQPPHRGEWALIAWELRRYHPGCVCGFVLDAATPRRPGDPAPLYPPAPDPPAATDLFWWTYLPAAGVPAMIWQPELAQPIVAATGDLYPVGDKHLQRVARLGGQWSNYGPLVVPTDDRAWSPPAPSWCRVRLGAGAIAVVDSYVEDPHADGPLVMRATNVPDDWAAAARQAGTVVLLALAGGTLPADTPTAGIWHDPRLRTAIDGPTPHMLPLDLIPDRRFDLAELDFPTSLGDAVTDLASPPVATRARIMTLRVEAEAADE